MTKEFDKRSWSQDGAVYSERQSAVSQVWGAALPHHTSMKRLGVFTADSVECWLKVPSERQQESYPAGRRPGLTAFAQGHNGTSSRGWEAKNTVSVQLDPLIPH